MIRIYGIHEHLTPIKAKLSDVINQCMVDALAFPENKRRIVLFRCRLTISITPKAARLPTP